MRIWINWICLILAGVYLWLYPSILLVPDEYREGFWSGKSNVSHSGLVVRQDVITVSSLLHDHNIYRIGVLMNGSLKYFWVATASVYGDLIMNELNFFETRGNVIVLVRKADRVPVVISLLNR